MIWRTQGLVRIVEDGMEVGIPNDKNCNHDPKKQDHGPENPY